MTSQIPTTIPKTLDAAKIAAFSLHDPKNPSIQIQSTELRISIISKFDIRPGSKVLEVGCGQGDTTAVLAVVVGEGGKVVALDPGPLDYGRWSGFHKFLLILSDRSLLVLVLGAPYTLGQAQGHLSKGPLGSRITFIQSTAKEHVDNIEKNEGNEYFWYDYGILSLSSFYFSSTDALRETLQALTSRCKNTFVAEWSLSHSKSFPVESNPHVAAVLLRATLDSRRLKPESNCRTLLSPGAFKKMVESADISSCKLDDWFDPPESCLDGRWEVEMVLSDEFEKDLEEIQKEMKEMETKMNIGGKDGRTQEELKLAKEAKERDLATIMATRDSIRSNLPANGVKGVKSMAIWWGLF